MAYSPEDRGQGHSRSRAEGRSPAAWPRHAQCEASPRPRLCSVPRGLEGLPGSSFRREIQAGAVAHHESSSPGARAPGRAYSAEPLCPAAPGQASSKGDPGSPGADGPAQPQRPLPPPAMLGDRGLVPVYRVTHVFWTVVWRPSRCCDSTCLSLRSRTRGPTSVEGAWASFWVASVGGQWPGQHQEQMGSGSDAP